jgi:hypothetical protein
MNAHTLVVADQKSKQEQTFQWNNQTIFTTHKHFGANS